MSGGGDGFRPICETFSSLRLPVAISCVVIRNTSLASQRSKLSNRTFLEKTQSNDRSLHNRQRRLPL